MVPTPKNGSNTVSFFIENIFISRYANSNGYAALLFLTLFSNMFTNLNLTDMETCYKVFKTEILKEIDLTEKGFGIEPELTAKIARKKCRIYEVGISYYGRSYDEGKKINWKDGLRAVFLIIKYGISR